MIVTFEDYTLNTRTLRLTRHGTVIELRPKTAELLRELVVSRDTVISKRQLIMNVWKTEHVSDQSLFQAMSELRRKLESITAIKTFPNRGYQWVVPVVEQPADQSTKITIEKPTVTPIAIAAIVAWFAAGVSTLLAVSLWVINETDHTSVQRHTLPALDTFSQGAAALQNGDADRATEFLQLSVIERPDFSEARLLLAEASLLGGHPLLARQQAQALIDSSEPLNSAYTLIGAMDLLSRSEQTLGQDYSALQWAAQAALQAGNNGFECTAANLQDRLWLLVDSTRHSPFAASTSPVTEPPLMQQILQAAQVPVPNSSDVMAWSRLDELLEDRVPSQRPAHCARPAVSPSSGYQSPSVQPERVVFHSDPHNPLI